MMRTRVGVLRGGPSPEYDVSLKTGASVLSHLPRERYQPLDIWIDKKGQWHLSGKLIQPEDAMRHVDVFFNAMHGAYGEDGHVQRILEAGKALFTGSRAVASALAMHKHRTKEVLLRSLSDEEQLSTPSGVHVAADDDVDRMIDRILDELQQPVVVKPLAAGSSVGVNIAHGRFALRCALIDALAAGTGAIVEEYILGREATCGVIEGYRGEDVYTLLPVEIVPSQDQPFFDYEAKYSGNSIEWCPGHFSHEQSERLQALAKLVHERLGLRHYSRSDFILGEDGEIYFLEVNTLPGLTKESLLPKEIAAIGLEYADFLDHVLQRAMIGK